ncbi:thiamine phosphate synthase [Candidatus Woesearchaeota archaeon]|nr:thiamine phosphate synthase [Candidatus Woesearchaeota archaeon]
MIDYSLYIVTESGLSNNRPNEKIVREAIRGGAGIVQLREKKWPKEKYFAEAMKISGICRENNVRFVVNDYPDIAMKVKADALHLGQDDMSLKEARKIVGKMKIGKSTHSLQQAEAAIKEGADYISIGPVFPTREKPNPVGTETVGKVARLNFPFVAIGGIKLHNLDSLLDAGAKTIAVISGIVSSENIYETTKKYVEMIRGREK